MSGIFLITILVGLAAFPLEGIAKSMEKEMLEEINLSLRDGTVLSGIPIPQFLIDIPFFGPLMKTFSSVVGGAAGSVLNPTMDIVALLTSNYLSKTSPLFMFFDNALGGALSAMSGSGGVIKPSVIDTGAITDVVSKTLTGAGGIGTSFLTPLINMLNIPGSAFGEVLKQFANIFQQFPMLKLVTAQQTATPAPVVAATVKPSGSRR